MMQDNEAEESPRSESSADAETPAETKPKPRSRRTAKKETPPAESVEAASAPPVEPTPPAPKAARPSRTRSAAKASTTTSARETPTPTEVPVAAFPSDDTTEEVDLRTTEDASIVTEAPAAEAEASPAPPLPPATVRIAFHTDVGQVRELNEDTVWAIAFEAANNGSANPWGLRAALLVADGVGGHAAGEVASGKAGELARRHLTDPDFAPENAPNIPLDDPAIRERLAAIVQDINAAVFTLPAGMEGNAGRPATTLTLCLLRADSIAIAHVGDSRAYHVRRADGESYGVMAAQVTEDHSFVGEAVRRGQMTEEDARRSPFRSQLTRAIGSEESVEASFYTVRWEPGDLLVVCSDGLSEYVVPDEIAALAANVQIEEGEGGPGDGDASLPDLHALCADLIARANRRGGRDNISVAVARCEGPEMWRVAVPMPPADPPQAVRDDRADLPESDEWEAEEERSAEPGGLASHASPDVDSYPPPGRRPFTASVVALLLFLVVVLLLLFVLGGLMRNRPADTTPPVPTLTAPTLPPPTTPTPGATAPETRGNTGPIPHNR
jgi:protein phosphatase